MLRSARSVARRVRPRASTLTKCDARRSDDLYARLGVPVWFRHFDPPCWRKKGTARSDAPTGRLCHARTKARGPNAGPPPATLNYSGRAVRHLSFLLPLIHRLGPWAFDLLVTNAANALTSSENWRASEAFVRTVRLVFGFRCKTPTWQRR